MDNSNCFRSLFAIYFNRGHVTECNVYISHPLKLKMKYLFYHGVFHHDIFQLIYIVFIFFKIKPLFPKITHNFDIGEHIFCSSKCKYQTCKYQTSLSSSQKFADILPNM